MKKSSETERKPAENQTKNSKVTVNIPSLPKGGGALQGIGETLQPNAFSGTGSYSIPISTTSARGFEASLSLTYSSGSGNSPFGVGFNIALPNISRRTEKNIPRYRETDIFVFSEVGELVVGQKDENGKWTKDLREEKGEGNSSWKVTIYRPRVEKAFDKIEYWECVSAGTSGFIVGTSYWKILSRNNVTSLYGRDDHARISDPENQAHILQWLLQESVDPRGNKIEYSYKAESDANVPKTIYEQNRSVTANRYIERIKYGNYFDINQQEQFAFELVFDCGEYDLSNLDQPNAQPYVPTGLWSCRPDPFSSYRSGFEIRTLRLCRNIMMFHHIREELGEEPCLTRVTHLQYKESKNISSLEKIRVTGYRRQEDGSYIGQSMPVIELGFSSFDPPAAPGFKPLEVGNDSLPGNLDQTQFLPVDLYAEGLPGFLYSNKETTLYLQPQGGGTYSSPEAPFEFPIDKDIQSGEVTLTDLEGDGTLDLMVNNPRRTGFYAQRDDRTWAPFQPFESYPTNASDISLEQVDLVANGKSDLMQVLSNGLSIYYSEGQQGYSPAQQVSKKDGFPSPKGDYLEEFVSFANMFGDGLAHRVSVQNGNVVCMPNLGYGRFGDKVTFGNAPHFSGKLNIRRLLFADIDGTGTQDLIYIHPDHVDIYFNQSGNSFSDPLTLMLPELYSEIDKIQFVDILGNGTTCLLFTKIEPTPRHYFYNFVGETAIEDGTLIHALKPYLLTRIDNNMGAVTYIQYGSSTKFYLEDKRAGRPWMTRLPFPVQVVESVIHLDRLNGSRLVNCFRYHDGYYDPKEREFRGFGYVEAWDTESFGSYWEWMKHLRQTEAMRTFQPLPRELYLEPVYTRTWYHTGAFIGRGIISKQYQSEYFHGDKAPYNLPDSILDLGLSDRDDSETVRQAYAALRGTVIRSEVYGLDDHDKVKSSIPYTVDESNVEVVLMQPRHGQPYAVFMVNPHENISYQYDQNSKDPRVQQRFTLQTDLLSGEVEKTCTVFLPRRSNLEDDGNAPYPEQAELKAAANMFTYIDTPDDFLYRWRGIRCQEQQFQIFELDLEGKNYFTFDDLKRQVETALDNIVPYEGELQKGTLQARQLTWTRTFYWNETQRWDKTDDGALPLGGISSKGLVHHRATAEFTTEFVQRILHERLKDSFISEYGGHVYEEKNGYWWNRGLVQYYYREPSQFHMPIMTQNPYAPYDSPLNTKIEINYQAPYYFSPVKVTQYLNASVTNIQTLEIDYQVMQPYQMVDINNNVAQIMFDPLGQVTVSSLFDPESETPMGGMRLYPYQGQPAQYQPRLRDKSGGPITFDHVLQDPEYYLQGASQFFFYDPLAWENGSVQGKYQPVSSIELKRNDDYQTARGITSFSCITTIAYTDGDSRALETKLRVDSGPAIIRDSQGKLIKSVEKKGDRPSILVQESNERWQVSGRTVYNNKGNPTLQYLPYFSNTPYYETQPEIVEEAFVPPPMMTYYDPLQRVVRVDTPKGLFTRIQYNPWQEVHWDEDDTVKDSEYYTEFMKHYPPDPTQQQKDEKDALDKAALFYGTPSVRVLNNQGNAFLDIQDNQQEHLLTSYVKLDIQGRVLEAIDPRLYRSNLDKDTQLYNFKYAYLMGQQAPVCIDSADAGNKMHFNNIFGNLIWSWSPRDYNQLIFYDGLQRRLQIQVKKMTADQSPLSSDDYKLVEQYTYGETQPDPERHNLRGEIYDLKDLSGIVTNNRYDIRGQVLDTSRQMAVDYKNALDWKKEVSLEPGLTFSFTYDALKRLTRETAPDESVTTNTYNQAGLLESVKVTYKDGTEQPVIDSIQYDAKQQRLKIAYGNGIITAYAYEDTTLRLIRLYSSRPNKGRNSDKEIAAVQDINYTYDPVGNITRTRDFSYETVFNNNQKVEPLSDYTYDALYRLIKANGRQNQEINRNTFINNRSAGDFKQSKFSLLPNDGKKLETYNETYSYDDAGNLVKSCHRATNPWTRRLEILPDSNRLKTIVTQNGQAESQDIVYDDSGNQQQLYLNSSVKLTWNCCENLVRAGIIERPDEMDDCDYYMYDNNEQRTRRVCERMAHQGAVTQIEEKIYLGNYEIKRNKSVNTEGQACTTFERQTLRVMDDETCVAIIHYIVTDNQNPGKAETRQCRFQMGNNLGSVSMERDIEARLISYEEYFPYGGTSIIAGDNQKEVEPKEYRYSRKECDDSTGLYYYGARYYASWLGRWLKPDPAGTVDGLNLYAFVRNNPISNADPSGMMQSNVDNIRNQRMQGLISNGVTMNRGLLDTARARLTNFQSNPNSTTGQATRRILNGWFGNGLTNANLDNTVNQLLQSVTTLSNLYNRGAPKDYSGICGFFTKIWDFFFGDDPHVERFVTSNERPTENSGTRTMMSVPGLWTAIQPITVYENNWNGIIDDNRTNYANELQLYVAHTIMHEQFHKYTGAEDISYIDTQNGNSVVTYRDADNPRNRRRQNEDETAILINPETAPPELINNADTLAGIVVQLGYGGDYNAYRGRLNDSFQPGLLAQITRSLVQTVNTVTNWLGFGSLV